MKNYIQIGTNKGNDDFMSIMKNLDEKSRIIHIETQPELIELIETSYCELKEIHDITILNVGIVVDKKINTLYKYKNDTDSALTSIIDRKSVDLESEEIKFKPLTFQELCDNFCIYDIDLLFIDTEGYDYEIINSIDFSKVNIAEIICEKWPFDIDSSDDIKTGPSYFNNVLLKKLSNYELKEFDEKNHKFLKKKNQI